jgi:hypothetical protein
MHDLQHEVLGAGFGLGHVGLVPTSSFAGGGRSTRCGGSSSHISSRLRVVAAKLSVKTELPLWAL